MRPVLISLACLAACGELADTYGEPAASCGTEAPTTPFSECSPVLDGATRTPIEILPSSPCFSAWGEAIEHASSSLGGEYRVARTRQPIIAIEDADGPHFGELTGYGKWWLPLPTDVATHYEIQVFLEPDPVATDGAKYKIWSQRRGSCYRTISQRVSAPRWVSLGVYYLGPFQAAMRLDNLTTETNESSRIQLGPVRFILFPLCHGKSGIAVSTGERCQDEICVELLDVAAAAPAPARLRVEAPGPFSVRLYDVVRDVEVSEAILSNDCFEDFSEVPVDAHALSPITHLRVTIQRGCGIASDTIATFEDLVVAECEPTCPGF